MDAFTNVVCPACESPETERLFLCAFEMENLGVQRHLYQCEHCGLLFKHPEIPADRQAQYWKSIYSEHRDEATWNKIHKRYDARFRSIAESTVSYLKRIGAQPTAVLDIGGQSGYFLQVLSEELESITSAPISYQCLDPGEDAANVGRRLFPKVNFTVSRLEDADLGERRFDLIFAIGCIYRFSDLEEAMRKLRSAAASGARLAVVADYVLYRPAFEAQSGKRRWNPADLLFSQQFVEQYFSPGSFRQFLSRYGQIVHSDYLGEGYGHLLILDLVTECVSPPKSSGQEFETRTESSSVIPFAKEVTALDVGEFFDAHSELTGVFVISDGESGEDLIAGIRENAPEVAVGSHLDIRAVWDSLPNSLRSAWHKTGSRSTTALMTSLLDKNLERTVLDAARNLGLRAYPSLTAPRPHIPYATHLRNGNRIVWYSHVPRRIELQCDRAKIASGRVNWLKTKMKTLLRKAS